MGLLILIRHGQSLWNAQNRFTGWVDIGFQRKGWVRRRVPEKLSEIEFDVVYASGPSEPNARLR